MRVLGKLDGVSILGYDNNLNDSPLYMTIVSFNVNTLNVLFEIFSNDKSDWKLLKSSKNGNDHDIFDAVTKSWYNDFDKHLYKRFYEYAIKNKKITVEEMDKKVENAMKLMLSDI